MDEDIEKWVKIAEYDWQTAAAMVKAGRYLYVLFCCQQAIEKHLKAIIVKETRTFPPRIHDLLKLAATTSLRLSDEQRIFLDRLNTFYIESRYPEEAIRLSKEATKQTADLYFAKTQEMLKWLRKALK
jgi:HEPN domain-containing protein